MSKGLVVGVLGALLLGAAEAVGEMAFAQAASSSGPADGFTVPVGSVGDRVSYDVAARFDDKNEWKANPPVRFEVAGTGEALDRTGQSHRVVFVQEDALAWVVQGGVANLELKYDYNWTYVNAYSLATRDAITGFRGYDLKYTSQFVLTNAYAGAATERGPFPVSISQNETSYMGIEQALHQGVTYEPGEDASAWALDRMAATRGLGLRWAAVDNLTLRGIVGGAAMMAGREALPLEIEGCVEIRPLEAGVRGIPFLNAVVPAPSKGCFEYVEWVTADSPYPIRAEARFEFQEKPSWYKANRIEFVSALRDFRAGTRPIPWTADDAGTPYRESDPGAERSPSDLRRPTDGTGHGLGFRLSDALDEIAAEPQLLLFQQWKAAHPDARIAGLFLVAHGQDPSGRRWEITWADPAGKSFVVFVERAKRDAQSVVTQMGEVESKPFNVDDLPTAPVTLKAADDLWKKYGLDHRRLAPNFARWGYVYREAGVSCPALTPGCVPTTPSARDSFGFNALAYGWEDGDGGNGRANADIVPTQGKVAVVMVALEEGYSYLSVDYENSPYLSAGLDRLGGSGSPNGAPAAAPDAGSSRIPPIRNAALLTLSLLGLVLVSYFWPLVKATGAHALMVMPGYAKLHRDQLLNNKVRDALVQAIRLEPGVDPPQLQKLTGAAWSTVIYHLGVLEKNKLVSSLIDGRHRRYFPADSVNAGDRTGMAVLKNLRAKALFEILNDEPGLDRETLARRLGISRPGTYWHLGRLERVGLVGRDKDGRKARFYALQNTVGGAPPDPNAMEVA
ncbi:MAG: winged helix-turn-helix transcriptional regulator [Euryarchaeota archaeon]|nr:winged helix-turn-helix transcriptional regulator [Euryarchaeota archaeon]